MRYSQFVDCNMILLFIYFNKGDGIMDNKLDNFKEFVRNNNHLIGYIKKNNKSWQDVYEIYDLYGEDESAWNKFLSEEQVANNDSRSKSNYMEDIVRIAKKVDMDKVQEGITSLQKTLGLFGDLIGNKGNNSNKEYNPRPLYRRFED